MRLDPSSIANAIWALVPIARRSVTASTVSDKTGYSLTAGSYVQRASSSQHGQATANPTTVSSVTTSRAHLSFSGGYYGQDSAYLSSSTAITGASATGIGYSLSEYF